MAKKKKFNFKSKKTWKQILLITISCILIVGLFAGISAMFREKEEPTKETISPSVFSIGGLTDDGRYLETDESIYTKDAISCDGLVITPNFESVVKYQVYFYDEELDFMSKTEMLQDKFSNVPNFARYCRVVITPNDDQKISWYEVNGYAKQIKIEVDIEQDFGLDFNIYKLSNPAFEVIGGKYWVANTNQYGEQADFTTYKMTFDKDTMIYIDIADTTCAVQFNIYNGTSTTRYTNTLNNLPSIDNLLSVKAGDTLYLCINNGGVLGDVTLGVLA